MDKTLIALFDTRTEAQEALSALNRDGFSSTNARISSSEDHDSLSSGHARISSSEDPGLEGEGVELHRSERMQSSEGGLGEAVARFLGLDDDDGTYGEAVRRGGFVLTVDLADDAEADRAQAILYRHNPVDIDERVEQWRQSGWEKPLRAQPEDRFVHPLPENDMSLTGGAAVASSRGVGDTEVTDGEPATEDGRRVIPVVEEQLVVGKREVRSGGIRIITRTTEKPVEAIVSLREEHATVIRRPVDRPVTDADTAFEDRTIEISEAVEEAVVSKTARVVEEVAIGKEVSEREEIVKDTVRKTDIHVQQVGVKDTSPRR